jgi:MarR family transcriptional regulator for hemolysin
MPDLEPQASLGFVLSDVTRFLRKRFEQNARAEGLELTRTQWQVLARLSQMEGIQQGLLAEKLEVEPITLVRIIDRLESLGLAERRRHPSDRRAWQLHLTPAAHPMIARMHEISDRTRQEALAGLPDPERAALLQALLQMKTNLVEACERRAETEEARRRA